MHRPTLRTFVILAVLAIAGTGSTACSTTPTSSGDGTPVAVVVMQARTKGSGYTTAPTANFYRTQSYQFASAESVVDTCQQTLYAPTNLSSVSGGTVIGAGAFVLVSVSGHADTLKRGIYDNITYALGSTSGLAFTPGDSVTFTIPGDAAGFPGATIKGRTAEPFTFNPVVVPPSGQGLALTWSPPTDPHSAMIVQFLFNDATTTELNEQIYCEFRDDGSATVRANLISLWASATVRDIAFERVRTLQTAVSGGNTGYFSFLSVYDLPTPVSP